MEDNKRVLIGVALFGVVVGAGFYARQFLSAPSPAVPTPPSAEAPAPAAPPAAAPEPVLPKLEDSDDAFRARAARLSSDARFSEWIVRDSLIQRASAAVAMIGAGRVPADALSFLAPRKRFLVKTAGKEVLVDPRGYARYDKVADVFASLDARAAARLFSDFKSLIQEAYQGAAGGHGDVWDAFVRAASELLSAPVLDKPAPLKPSEKGITYVYAEEALEKLDPAQKQLMRMGPRNERKIQAKLRELAAAMGVPDSVLPAPSR